MASNPEDQMTSEKTRRMSEHDQVMQEANLPPEQADDHPNKEIQKDEPSRPVKKMTDCFKASKNQPRFVQKELMRKDSGHALDPILKGNN